MAAAPSERILFNELRPGQIVVIGCEGDPAQFEKSKLIFSGADRPGEVPDAVTAELAGGGAATEEPALADWC